MAKVKVKEVKKEVAKEVKPTIGGYNDLVSRARRVSLADDASEKDIVKAEEARITKAPK